MTMNRRAFSAALVAGVAASLISTRGMAANSTPVKARNVVLVHGLFADGSCWTEVIVRLQAAGLNVTSVQNPLTTLPDAVASDMAAHTTTYSVLFDGDVGGSTTRIGGLLDGSAWGPVGQRPETDPYFAEKVCNVAVTP